MGSKGYFHRVAELTPTKFWINNVTPSEAQLAIENGAVGCTQNPAYSWKMVSHPTESGAAQEVLRETLSETGDDNEAVCILQRKLVSKVAKVFLPVWEKSHGKLGYVSIQGDPIHEEDPQVIIDEGRKNREMGPNVMIKIPATKAGLEAMQVLLEENTPINATEVMGLRQAIDVCDMYDRVSSATGHYPVSVISHIAGIYDEYLQGYVREKNIDISRDILFQAGLAVARKVYKMMQDRATPLGFVGGGVRGLHHFTEMVGGNVNITINWEGTADKLLELDPPVVERLFNPVPDHVIDVLLQKVEDFRRAWFENGLTVKEYEEFGPVEFFRHSFVSAWERVRAMAGTMRSESQTVELQEA